LNQVLIYGDRNSPRLKYIFDFILIELLGLQYEVTQDRVKFRNHTGAKFSYSLAPLADELFFEAAPLLFETALVLQPVDFFDYENITGFYPLSKRSTIPFDPFASAFLMITGYNEYLLSKKDKYDRYRASQSLNYRAGFMEKPMINLYALQLKKILGQRFPELQFKQNRFKYTATFDIDMAYSYLEKGLITNLGGFMRSFMLSDFTDMKTRYDVLFNGRQDPFDTYDYIFEVCGKNNIETKFFFLVGDKSRFDKNIASENERFRQLIRDIAEKSDIGIHLSYGSHVSNGVMQLEMKRLEEITGKMPTSNRFHYLRFTLPSSYMRLQKIGIKEDYSMAYATRIGFRSATCNPYYFFNLTKNEVTDLKIYPFAFMDTTLSHYKRLTAEESLERIKHMMKAVKEVEGPCIGLWHNSSFTEQGEWKGWREVFELASEYAGKLMEQGD
jgi:hypothetical protein